MDHLLKMLKKYIQINGYTGKMYLQFIKSEAHEIKRKRKIISLINLFSVRLIILSLNNIYANKINVQIEENKEEIPIILALENTSKNRYGDKGPTRFNINFGIKVMIYPKG